MWMHLGAWRNKGEHGCRLEKRAAFADFFGSLEMHVLDKEKKEQLSCFVWTCAAWCKSMHMC